MESTAHEKCHWCSNGMASLTFMDFLSTFFFFTSGTELNILLVCGGGAAGSGCCDYQTVMNALLMRSEQLGSASASMGRMTATVHLTPPSPIDTMTFCIHWDAFFLSPKVLFILLFHTSRCECASIRLLF